MNRKAIFALGILTVFLFCYVTSTPSLAADYTKIGVKQYDVATYSVGVTGSTVNSMKITVNSISGVMVSLTKDEYTGSTLITTHTFTINVTSGEGQDWQFMVAADLTVHDMVATDYPGYWFNSTVSSYSIGGAAWTANHIAVSISGVTLDAYFDKPSGWMLKWVYHNNVAPPGYWYNYSLTSFTNSPPAPIPWVIIIGAGALVVAIAAIAILIRRRK